jgi:hypothetical protein
MYVTMWPSGTAARIRACDAELDLCEIWGFGGGQGWDGLCLRCCHGCGFWVGRVGSILWDIDLNLNLLDLIQTCVHH